MNIETIFFEKKVFQSQKIDVLIRKFLNKKNSNNRVIRITEVRITESVFA